MPHSLHTTTIIHQVFIISGIDKFNIQHLNILFNHYVYVSIIMNLHLIFTLYFLLSKKLKNQDRSSLQNLKNWHIVLIANSIQSLIGLRSCKRNAGLFLICFINCCRRVDVSHRSAQIRRCFTPPVTCKGYNSGLCAPTLSELGTRSGLYANNNSPIHIMRGLVLAVGTDRSGRWWRATLR